MEIRSFLAQFVDIFLWIVIYAIFARVILSWVRPIGAKGGLAGFLFEVTEPILSIFRKIIPRLGMLDLSPIVALFVIQYLRAILVGLLLPVA